MKNLKYRTSGLFFILLVTFFMIGCVSDPVEVDLPANHPANPEAQEAEFIPPPNPFQEDVSSMKMESTTESMVKHKPQKESGKQHMNHHMGTDKKSHSDSESKMKPEETEGHDQH